MRIWMYAIPIVGIAALVGGLLLVTTESDAPRPIEHAEELLLLAGQSLRPPIAGVEVEHGGGVLDLYRRRGGATVDVHYDRSADLLEHIRQTQQGDLFMPGDDVFIQRAEQEGLIAEVIEVAQMVPAILVMRGNPDGIETVADLADPALRLGIADRNASEIGRVAHELLEAAGVSLADHGTVITRMQTATDLARLVQQGEADAAIVWLSVATQYPRNTQIVQIDGAERMAVPLRVAVLETSQRKEDARRLAEFIAGARSQHVFEQYQYHVPGG